MAQKRAEFPVEEIHLSNNGIGLNGLLRGGPMGNLNNLVSHLKNYLHFLKINLHTQY